MNRLSSTAVSYAGSDITIDADALAPKLGLSAEALKEKMAKGLVTSVAESGIEEDLSDFFSPQARSAFSSQIV